jgi:hypothetical protein
VECIIGSRIICGFLSDNLKIRVDVFLLYIAVISSLIGIILIFSPELHSFVKESILVTRERVFNLDFRGFAISSDIFFSYAVAQGIALAFCLYYLGKRDSKMSYLWFLCLITSVFFNARIGFVPILVYILYILCIERSPKYILINGIIITLSLCIITSLFFITHEPTVTWVLSAFDETSAVLVDGDVGVHPHYDALFDSMIILPDTPFSLFFGTGKDLFYDSCGKHSDCGYIIQLNYGGLFFLLLLFLLVSHMFFRLKKNNSNNKWFTYVFVGTILLCNWKGYFISTNVGFRYLSILYFYYVIVEKNESCHMPISISNKENRNSN